MRNCRGDFEFDEVTRRFIKKIQARKFVEPLPLHKELGRPAMTLIIDERLIQISGEQIEKAGWKRK